MRNVRVNEEKTHTVECIVCPSHDNDKNCVAVLQGLSLKILHTLSSDVYNILIVNT